MVNVKMLLGALPQTWPLFILLPPLFRPPDGYLECLYEKVAVVATRIQRSMPGSVGIVCLCFSLFCNLVVEVQVGVEIGVLTVSRVSATLLEDSDKQLPQLC